MHLGGSTGRDEIYINPTLRIDGTLGPERVETGPGRLGYQQDLLSQDKINVRLVHTTIRQNHRFYITAWFRRAVSSWNRSRLLGAVKFPVCLVTRPVLQIDGVYTPA